MSSHSAAHLNINWPEPTRLPELRHTDVHVWAASLEGEAATWAKLLSPTEQERAAAFHFELHRRRFSVGRGLLRLILSRYLNAQPEEVDFTCGSHGKPELCASFATNELRFNLAHSEDLAIVAVTHLGAVGVDLERIAPLKDMDDLVARFFSARENERFQKLPPDQKPPAFF